MRGGGQPRQLARVPYGIPGVGDDSAAVTYVQTEERDRAQEVELPRRVAERGIREAARERESEDLTAGRGAGIDGERSTPREAVQCARLRARDLLRRHLHHVGVLRCLLHRRQV